jgi:hypothetical protein
MESLNLRESLIGAWELVNSPIRPRHRGLVPGIKAE